MAAKKITQKPKAKSHPTGKSGGVKSVTGLSQQSAPKASGKGKTASMHGQNPMPQIREYPGEGGKHGKSFGHGVKIVGSSG